MHGDQAIVTAGSFVRVETDVTTRRRPPGRGSGRFRFISEMFGADDWDYVSAGSWPAHSPV